MPCQGEPLSLTQSGFTLREKVTYPNGGTSSFYVRDDMTVIIDEGICDPSPDGRAFDYSLVTSKQNAYVAQYSRVYRLLREDVDELDRWLTAADAPEAEDTYDIEFQAAPARRPADRANLADASPLERKFEEHFANVYGSGSERFLTREYAITDPDGRTRFVDYLVRTTDGHLFGIEENGVRYHHPQLIGKRRYRDQLLKQNSCQRLGIRLFRFSSEDIRFADRFEDDLRSYLGASTSRFVDPGLVVDRPFELYEHQDGALEEMERRRAEGLRSFLAVLPTGTGKSQIAIDDLARVAPTRPSFRALVTAPTTAIVSDWRRRVTEALPQYRGSIQICTYGYLCRHYLEFEPDHFSYIVVDEAHHAVAPALKRAIQHFDPDFLVGLTATDQRPDKKRLESVFGSYRTSLSLSDAMERGIVATARAFRVETNVDLSHVRVNGREYVNADLEKTVRVTSRNELIVDVLQRYFTEGAAGRRQGVVFCVNVRHAKEMERLLNNAGIPTRTLSGQTRNPDRVMADFRARRIRFLCSCQMISEGWDYPELGILVMARPTLSRVLYLQQLGRGLRRTPSKQDVFVVDVVDEYGAMVRPCSLHSIFQNPYYVPFGDVLRRDYEPGEWVEVDGIRERIERVVPVEVASFAERYEGWLSVEQLARDFFVNTGTINSWIRRGRIVPSASFPFGSRTVHLFSPEDVATTRERLQIPVHDDSTVRDDFLAFLEERDYSLSYKMPFLLAFLERMDPATGTAPIDDVLDGYAAFYRDRLERGLPVDRPSCPYTLEFLSDRASVRRSMLANPFEKFERKRFMYHSRDLGEIALNHALLARMADADWDRVRAQMRADLEDYYARV